MSTTFNSPQLLKRYSDGTIRIVTHQNISIGDNITFKNERWLDETKAVVEIKEQRPSMGDFADLVPTSYRLSIS